MSKTELRERVAARAMYKVIDANAERAEEVGRTVACGFDVTPSQTSAFVIGQAVDRDGNVVHNRQMLRAFHRPKTSQESDSDNE